MQTHEIQLLMDKLKELPPERLAEVEDFIDFLSTRIRRRPSARNESRDFPVISVGRWPEDVSLRRENLYGDDGR